MLREVIEQLDPDFEPALDELIEACEAVSDQRTLAWALERALRARARSRAPGGYRAPARTPVRTRPGRSRAGDRRTARVDACGTARARTAQASDRAADAEPSGMPSCSPSSMRSRTSTSGEGRAEALLSAAELAFDRMRDADGAWRRLLLLANIGNERAEALLSRVAFEGGKTDELIALYQSASRYDDLIAVLRDQAERASRQGDQGRAVPALRAAAHRSDRRRGRGGRSVSRGARLHRERRGVDATCASRRCASTIPRSSPIMAGRLADQSRDRDERRDLMFERALLLERPARAAGTGDRSAARDRDSSSTRTSGLRSRSSSRWPKPPKTTRISHSA